MFSSSLHAQYIGAPCHTPSEQTEGENSPHLCDVFGDEPDLTINSGNASSFIAAQGTDFFENKYIFIRGVFRVDQLIWFSNCRIEMDFAARINVLPGNGLFITDDSKVFCCDRMWDEINVPKGAWAVIRDSEIEDAVIAVHSIDSDIFVYGNTFNANTTCIRIENQTTGSGSGGFSHPRITNNQFLGSEPLKNPNSLVEFPFCGINASNALSYLNSDNTFSELGIGMIMSGGYGFSRNNTFRNMRDAGMFSGQEQGQGIVMDNMGFAYIYSLDGLNTFQNCPVASISAERSSFRVFNCSFLQIGDFAINVISPGAWHLIERSRFTMTPTDDIEQVVHIEKGRNGDIVANNTFFRAPEIDAIVHLNGPNNSKGHSTIFQNRFNITSGNCTVVDGFESDNINIQGFQGNAMPFPPLQIFDQGNDGTTNPSITFRGQGSNHFIRGNHFWHGSGLLMEGANNCVVCHNSFDGHPSGLTQQLAIALHLTGDCMGSNLSYNGIKAGYNTGLFYDGNGINIGPHAYSGNFWVENFGGGSTYVEGGAVTNSTDIDLNFFTVNSDDNPLCFPTEQGQPSVVVPAGLPQIWFTDDDYFDNSTSCPIVLPFNKIDIALLNDELDPSYAHYWSAQYQLYKKLKEDFTVVPSEYTNQASAFLLEREQGTIGKLYAVNREIALAAGDESGLLEDFSTAYDAIMVLMDDLESFHLDLPSDDELPQGLKDELFSIQNNMAIQQDQLNSFEAQLAQLEESPP